jgi:Flp pilus assembly protein TadG
MTMRRSWKALVSQDHGTLTLFTVIVALGLLISLGFVVDGGIKLEAGQQARAIAEEAARAGEGEINRSAAYATGAPLVIDPGPAAAAASAYISAAGATGSVEVTGPDQITVTVTVRKSAVFLRLLGIDSLQGTATATADLLQGIERPGQ